MNNSCKRIFLELIQPLGISAARKKDNKKLALFLGGISDRNIVLFQTANHNVQVCMRSNVPFIIATYSFSTYKEALDSLLKDITSFYTVTTDRISIKSNNPFIEFDNPYLGCQSLEEAFIKKDLLDN